MNKLGKIFFVILLLLFAGHICFAQDKSQQRDSLQLKVKKSESGGNLKEQGTKGNGNKQAGLAWKNNPSQAVKQVKGARPDMSKARGARPPYIVRPSGSRIPKGIGRPAGAGRPGRR